MNVIRLYCSRCGRKIKVAAHFAGREGKCPNCRKNFIVPEADDAIVPAWASSFASNMLGPDARATRTGDLLGERATIEGEIPAKAEGGDNLDELAKAVTEHQDKIPLPIAHAPTLLAKASNAAQRNIRAREGSGAARNATYRAKRLRIAILVASAFLPLPITIILLRHMAARQSNARTPAPVAITAGSTDGGGGQSGDQLPQSPPAPILDVLSPADSAERQRQIDQQLTIVRQVNETRVLAHRKTMESLCDELRQACLNEPDVPEAFENEGFVEQQTLWAARDGGVVDDVFLKNVRSAFARTETQSVIDRMIAEALRRHAELDHQQQGIIALEAQSPKRQRIDRWNHLVDDVRQAQREAGEILRGADSGVQDIQTRSDIERLLDRIEANDRTRLNRTTELERRLQGLQQQVNTFQPYASDDAALANATRGTTTAIGQSLQHLDASAATNRQLILAYHRRFLTSLPADLRDLQSIDMFGRQVLQAKAQSPPQWSLAALSSAYLQLQGAAFDRWLQSAPGLALRKMESAHQTGLAAFADDGQWHQAAMALGVEQLDLLRRVLTTGLLDPTRVGDRQRLVEVAEDAIAEHRIPNGTKGGGLVPVSAVLEGRKTGLIDAGAREHHQSVFQHLNEHGTMADIGEMMSLVAQDSAAYPLFWNDAVRQVYADYQSNQWWQFTEARFDDTVLKLADLYVQRDHTPFDRERWTRAAEGVSFTARELQAIHAMLNGGAISPEELAKTNPSTPGRPGRFALLTRRWTFDAKTFFDEISFVKEQALPANKPPLAAINPSLPYYDTALREYHAALIRRFNKNKTLADVVAMKLVVDNEYHTHPEKWQDERAKSSYAKLQFEQWLAFSETHFTRDARTVSMAYLNKKLNRGGWANAARPWKPYAHDMLALLNGGRIDEGNFRMALAASGKLPEFGSPGYMLDPIFWKAVQDAP